MSTDTKVRGRRYVTVGEWRNGYTATIRDYDRNYQPVTLTASYFIADCRDERTGTVYRNGALLVKVAGGGLRRSRVFYGETREYKAEHYIDTILRSL
jgi:hypothetical protein